MLCFTIRDVLWLTVVVGLAVGWFVERSRLAKQRDEFEQKAMISEGNFDCLEIVAREHGIRVIERNQYGLTVDSSETMDREWPSM